MAALSGLFFFIFGTAIGSFLNVLILRYKPEGSLFNWRALSGRSHCPSCKKTLSWTELIPFFSYIFLHGKCSSCRTRISFQYPLIELVTGLVFLCVPLFLNNFYGLSQELFFSFSLPPFHYFLAGLWILAFVCFIVVTAIDLKHYIIPDELVALIGIIGVLIAWIVSQNEFSFSPYSASFIRHYLLVFSPSFGIFALHALGAFVAGAFFLLLVFLTRGRGMGMGDVKFMFSAGLLFGWPDIALASFFAFLTGGVFSMGLYFLRKKGMKDKIPFGPFLVLGLLLTFFVGYPAVQAYFSLFGI